MNKAFIFDLDGVLIDNESMWEISKEKIYLEIFGRDIMERMGSTVGINMDGIYELAIKNGSNVSKEVFVKAFYDQANEIYRTAPLTSGIDGLLQTLKELKFKIGIVSASPKEWIDIVTSRIKDSGEIKIIVSLFDRPDLPHKPEPDGYLEAIRLLGSTPKNTLILEDSNTGIKSGKNAGAFTIGFRENLVKGYEQREADIYANNLSEVEKIVKRQSGKMKVNI